MTHPPLQFARISAARRLILLLVAASLCTVLPGQHDLLAGWSAPVWQAGDDDKGGMGTG